MTTEMPSSDELIRRAKETLSLDRDDFLPKIDQDIADMRVSMGGVQFRGDASLDETTPTASSVRTPPTGDVYRQTRVRRVDSSTQDHLATAPRDVRTVSVPVPPSVFSGGGSENPGRWMRILGTIILAGVAVFWVFLLIGTVDNPDDLGEVIGGGVGLTLVPFLFGTILRRAGRRRGVVA
ncbi:MAG: hypothetical protein M3092_08625 [Actinomycetia bacterium]|nr:hypothetical protein [Actinomycetes bacterium]